MEDFKEKVKNFLIKIDPFTLKIIKIGDMLPNLIRNYLISEIVREIPLEKNIHNYAIRKFYSENKIGNKTTLREFLKAKAISENELHYQIVLNLKINKYAKQNFKNELNDYFLSKKELLDEYEFNIIRVRDLDLANELYFQLDSEESDFAQLSKSYSFYSPLYPDGVFGPKNLRDINPIIRNQLFNTSVGNLIAPFQVNNWWLIIKLIEKKNAQLDTNTSQMLLNEIFNIFISKLVKSSLEYIYEKN